MVLLKCLFLMLTSKRQPAFNSNFKSTKSALNESSSARLPICFIFFLTNRLKRHLAGQYFREIANSLFTFFGLFFAEQPLVLKQCWIELSEMQN